MGAVTASRSDVVVELGTVAEAMTGTVVAVQPDMTAGEALGLLRRKGIGGAPVVYDGRVIGIVTASDLLGPHPYPMQSRSFQHPRNGAAGWCVADLMTGSPVTTTADESLAHAVIRMAQTRVDRLPVVDEHERPIGIVAREDVVRVLARGLWPGREGSTASRPYLRPD